MDTPFMDIVQSGILRGFTESTHFYMSDLDDSSFSSLLLSFSHHSHNALPNYSCVCSWLSVRQKNFQKNTCGRSPCSRSSQKNARWRSGVFKKTSKTSSKPEAPELESFAPNLSKARETKQIFRNGHNSGKKRDNFELGTKIVPWEPRPEHSRVAESLPRPQLVIHPWRIYPSYGHWDDHFDDGYVQFPTFTGGVYRRVPVETGIPAVHPNSECRKVVLPCTTNGSDYCSCYCSCSCSCC